MEVLAKALSSSVQTRLKRHDHKPAQSVMEGSPSSALQLHSMLWDTVVAQMTHPMNSVFQQAIISFLILRPQYAATILHAAMSCLQHGPAAATAAVPPRQPYHKKLPLILACFRGVMCEPGQEGVEQAVGRDSLTTLCVTMLQCMAELFEQQQQLASAQQAGSATGQAKSQMPSGQPIHIHPNSLVRLFVDCMLEVHDSHARRQLLAQAMSASKHSSEGVVAGKQLQQNTEQSPSRPAKRQRIEEPSSCPVDNHDHTGFGLLLAQACHDDLLRYGSPTLAADVIWLSISHPALFPDADLAAAKQMLLKALPNQPAAHSSPAAGLDIDSLVRHAAWCHWAAHDHSHRRSQHCWLESSTDPLTRLLILLSSDSNASHSFPQPGSFINALTELILPKPSCLSGPSNTPSHVPVSGSDVDASKHGTSDTESESEHEAGLQEDTSVQGEPHEQLQPAPTLAGTSPQLVDDLATTSTRKDATTTQQGKQTRKKKHKQRQTPSGAETEPTALGGFLGFKAVQVVHPPLHPAWTAGALIPAVVHVIVDEENGCGGYALAMGAKGVLHSVLASAHVLLLPEQSPTMVGQACRALAGWAKSAPATHIENLADAWCSVWVDQPRAWKCLLDVTSLQGLSGLLLPCSNVAPAWPRVAALLCLCNHLPARSPLYCTALVAYLSLIGKPTEETESAVAISDAILGQRSPAPSFSYLDNCRTDMLRGALLVTAWATDLEKPRRCIASHLLKILNPTLQSICTGGDTKGLSSSAKKILTKACQAQDAVDLLSDSVFGSGLLQLLPALVRRVEDV